jgi:glucan phosphoethanolaminetransferase (alkaline phosphatase superfamily)
MHISNPIYVFFKRVATSKEFVASIIFTFVFVVLEAYILNIPYYDIWVKELFFRVHMYYYLFISIVLTLLSIGLMLVGVWLTLVSNKIWMICFSLLFVASVSIEYSYYKTLGHFSTPIDWFIALKTTEEQRKEIISVNAYLGSIPIVICYLIFIFFFHAKEKEQIKHLNKIQLFYICTAFIVFGKPTFTNEIFFAPSFSSSLITAVSYPRYLYENKANKREQLSNIKTNDKLPSNNIVLIIDESVRGDHSNFYDYPRQITPDILWQLKKEHYLVNWKECVSGTTLSSTSSYLLLTGIPNSCLPDKKYYSRQVPNIYQYAKSSGYKTYFLDGQLNEYWNGNKIDQLFIDNYLGVNNFDYKGVYSIDSLIAEKIKDILNDTTSRHFIWTQKAGVHAPYEKKYPIEEAKWLPIAGYSQFTGNIIKDSISRSHRINSYDNALIYNSNTFWASLFSEGNKNNNAVFVYTSDHGQTLQDNGEIRSHGGSYKKEASVPLFMINIPKQFKVDTNFLPHHENIFPTLLDLMEFPNNERKFKYEKSLFKATYLDNKPRYSWYGDYFLYSHGGKIKYD